MATCDADSDRLCARTRQLAASLASHAPTRRPVYLTCSLLAATSMVTNTVQTEISCTVSKHSFVDSLGLALADASEEQALALSGCCKVY